MQRKYVWKMRGGEFDAESAPLFRVLAARGLDADFFVTGADALNDPYLLPDMDKAAFRLKMAVETGERVGICGDYDADGVTGTVMLTEYLRSKGCFAAPFIPDRHTQGYGVHPESIEMLKEKFGVTLIVTADAGCTAFEAADKARELGLDYIVTDHHECLPELPKALAVVNAHRSDSKYPFKDLAGAGVVFKLLCAVEGNSTLPLAKYADLAAIGTVADVMPLTYENRAIVTAGLPLILSGNRPGTRMLLERGGVDFRTAAVNDASLISYKVAPMINAAGRLESANTAAKLLMTRNAAEAFKLAEKLDDLNKKRRELETKVTESAIAMWENDPGHEGYPAVFAAGEDWHGGVIGISAAHLLRRYGKPVFLMTADGGNYKGSSRSGDGRSVAGALAECSELLEAFGGHEQAAGFSVKRENLARFREKLFGVLGADPEAGSPGALDIDCELLPHEITERNAAMLERMAPFGKGNPEPVFLLRNAEVEAVSKLDARGLHSAVTLNAGGLKRFCVFFGTPPESIPHGRGDGVDVAFYMRVNRFRGRENVRPEILDMRSAV